jgi:hypothetical protein
VIDIVDHFLIQLLTLITFTVLLYFWPCSLYTVRSVLSCVWVVKMATTIIILVGVIVNSADWSFRSVSFIGHAVSVIVACGIARYHGRRSSMKEE